MSSSPGKSRFFCLLTQNSRGPVMNVCSRLAEIVRHGSARNHSSRQQQGGRRPQFETLEERAVPTLNLPTNPFLFTPINADHDHHLAVHMQARLEIFLDGKQI